MASVKALVLASQSPFRRQLMEAAGLNFTVRVAPIDETLIAGSSPQATAKERAAAKALGVAALMPDALVIGADQVLGQGERSFDKATSAVEATARLTAFSGRVHTLYSAVALAYKGTGVPRLVKSFCVDSAMPMRELSVREIAAYVATGEWQGCVGCYQYEQRGGQLFQGVTAEQSAIIGLPMPQLLAALRELGINPLLEPQPPWDVPWPA